MSLKFIEEEIQSRINSYRKKYLLIKYDENLDDTIDEAFNELEKIRNFIMENLEFKIPILTSKVLIFNRKFIRNKQNQYLNEVKAKTQCLLQNNTLFIDGNPRIPCLGFNNIPFIQFKFIGVGLGEYKINIPDNLPFGILYDFENIENNDYDFIEGEGLEITNFENKVGDPVIIREDKWINAPGDIDDEDTHDSLINIGPFDFEVQFYTGEITLNVTGNFGVVSYYIKDRGYMGGQKRLKFSEVCINNGEYNN